MADVTPEPADDAAQGSTGAAGKASARKTPARKTTARKPAAKRAVTKKPAAASASSSASETDASAAAPTEPAAPAEPAEQLATPAPVATASASTAPSAGSGSFLDKVRANRMGPLTAALAVALVTALLLSVLVPNEPGLLAMVILSAALAAAVGFTVRYLAHCRGLRQQVIALIATVIGVHVMSVTGTVGGEIPVVGDFIDAGIPFDDALLAALATPALSTGAFLSGLVAAIIAGWGEPKPGNFHGRRD
ncbi:hypothetical protein [uncultured Demequina sp.]|uniref:hypothetical protein n=1 Tax=uncultured Demequina sp. TaxID=693499 RepID=UPI0025F63C1C|nr:hypothetical protein [uncultured Demequina sp.]